MTRLLFIIFACCVLLSNEATAVDEVIVGVLRDPATKSIVVKVIDMATGQLRNLTGQQAIDVLTKYGWKCVGGNWINPASITVPSGGANIFVGAIVGLGAVGMAASAAHDVRCAERRQQLQIQGILQTGGGTVPGGAQAAEALGLIFPGQVPPGGGKPGPTQALPPGWVAESTWNGFDGPEKGTKYPCQWVRCRRPDGSITNISLPIPGVTPPNAPLPHMPPPGLPKQR